MQPVIWRPAGEAGAGGRADFSAEMRRMEREGEERAKAAHEAGVREGEAAGRSRAAGELKPVMDRLARAIEELAGMRARLRAEAEADLIQLALAIARRVLRRELAVDPEALHGLVLAALEKLQGQEICRVRVHPSHAAMLASCLREGGGRKMEIAADAAFQPGTVVFETTRGNLDASVESQLREIERGLADRLRRPA
ncbi:MAG: hypothetical protein LAQ30_14395 [Acidobacteriia bacterium]|nr:hypothetical protein [Terriglobia bacterium]